MVQVNEDSITERPPRDRLRRRQTPQGFRLEVIRRGYELARADPDFVAAYHRGIVLKYLPEVPVRLVPGSERSVTVTDPADIEIAEMLLAQQSRPASSGLIDRGGCRIGVDQLNPFTNPANNHLAFAAL